MIATGIATMKPGAAAIPMSNIPHGPPELNCQMLTVTVPTAIEGKFLSPTRRRRRVDHVKQTLKVSE